MNAWSEEKILTSSVGNLPWKYTHFVRHLGRNKRRRIRVAFRDSHFGMSSSPGLYTRSPTLK